MRSGSLTRPRPLVAFDCGSQSTSRVLTSAAASDAARLMAVVVLPTPPFWLATAITRPINFPRRIARQNSSIASVNSMFNLFHVEQLALTIAMFHVEQIHHPYHFAGLESNRPDSRR